VVPSWTPYDVRFPQMGIINAAPCSGIANSKCCLFIIQNLILMGDFAQGQLVNKDMLHCS